MASCKVFGGFMEQIYAAYSRVSSIYLPKKVAHGLIEKAGRRP